MIRIICLIVSYYQTHSWGNFQDSSSLPSTKTENRNRVNHYKIYQNFGKSANLDRKNIQIPLYVHNFNTTQDFITALKLFHLKIPNSESIIIEDIADRLENYASKQAQFFQRYIKCEDLSESDQYQAIVQGRSQNYQQTDQLNEEYRKILQQDYSEGFISMFKHFRAKHNYNLKEEPQSEELKQKAFENILSLNFGAALTFLLMLLDLERSNRLYRLMALALISLQTSSEYNFDAKYQGIPLHIELELRLHFKMQEVSPLHKIGNQQIDFLKNGKEVSYYHVIARKYMIIQQYSKAKLILTFILHLIPQEKLEIKVACASLNQFIRKESLQNQQSHRKINKDILKCNNQLTSLQRKNAGKRIHEGKSYQPQESPVAPLQATSSEEQNNALKMIKNSMKQINSSQIIDISNESEQLSIYFSILKRQDNPRQQDHYQNLEIPLNYVCEMRSSKSQQKCTALLLTESLVITNSQNLQTMSDCVIHVQNRLNSEQTLVCKPKPPSEWLIDDKRQIGVIPLEEVVPHFQQKLNFVSQSTALNLKKNDQLLLLGYSSHKDFNHNSIVVNMNPIFIKDKGDYFQCRAIDQKGLKGSPIFYPMDNKLYAVAIYGGNDKCVQYSKGFVLNQSIVSEIEDQYRQHGSISSFKPFVLQPKPAKESITVTKESQFESESCTQAKFNYRNPTQEQRIRSQQNYQQRIKQNSPQSGQESAEINNSSILSFGQHSRYDEKLNDLGKSLIKQETDFVKIVKRKYKKYYKGSAIYKFMKFQYQHHQDTINKLIVASQPLHFIAINAKIENQQLYFQYKVERGFSYDNQHDDSNQKTVYWKDYLDQLWLMLLRDVCGMIMELKQIGLIHLDFYYRNIILCVEQEGEEKFADFDCDLARLIKEKPHLLRFKLIDLQHAIFINEQKSLSALFDLSKLEHELFVERDYIGSPLKWVIDEILKKNWQSNEAQRNAFIQSLQNEWCKQLEEFLPNLLKKVKGKQQRKLTVSDFPPTEKYYDPEVKKLGQSI